MHGAWLHVFEWRPDEAEVVLRRAVELDPGSTTARHLYGLLLGATGRLEEAVQQKAHAVALDPLAPALSETLAFAVLAAGRTDEALHHVRNAIELDTTFWRAHSVLATIQEVAGRPEDAIRAYERANELARGRMHRTRADIARVLTGTKGTTFLLAHDPRRLTEAAALDVQLVLSGHTHGGQVVLPGIGALAGRKFPVLAGPARKDNATIFVSRGVGTVYVPVRINCPPEVVVLTLRKTP